jgi:Flp pilus assembly pilin Flp
MKFATVSVRCRNLFRPIQREEGQAVSEYAVMLGVVAILVITALWHIALNASSTFVETASQIR